MAIIIRDEHLEDLLNRERERRGDATMAKTLGDIARERLMELLVTRRDGDMVDKDKQKVASA